MEHTEAVLLLPDHLQQRLDEGVRKAVEAHVAGCAECRALAETYGVLSDALEQEEALRREGHLSSEEAALLVALPGAVPLAGRERLSAHLDACAACRDDVDAIREAHLAAAPASRSGRFVPGVAAGLALAAIAAFAYVSLTVMPGLRGRIEALEADRRSLETKVEDLTASLVSSAAGAKAVSEWSGAVAYLYLAEGTRGGGSPPILRVRRDQPFLFIAFRPATPIPAGDAFRIAIDAGGAAAAWDLVLGREEIQARLRETDSILLQIPARFLPPGRHALALSSAGAGSAAPFASYAFEVARSE